MCMLKLKDRFWSMLLVTDNPKLVNIGSPNILICGFVAQLVENRIGIAEVTGSNPVALTFFQASSFPLLKLENYCHDHSSLSY